MDISNSLKLAITAVRFKDRPANAALERSSLEGDLSETLNTLLAAVFELYVKSRNFQWYICGSQFHGCHQILEEHGDQLYAMIQAIVQHLREMGGAVYGPIGHLPDRRNLVDGEGDQVRAGHLLLELRENNQSLLHVLHKARRACCVKGDENIVGLIEEWLIEAEQRIRELREPHLYTAIVWK